MGQDFFGFQTGSQWDYENGFYLTSQTTRLAKTIALFELYRSIVHLPGQVVECGVYKGASLIKLATFREMLESPHSRMIVGFDAFGEFPEQADPEDSAFVAQFQAEGGPGIPIGELTKVLEYKSLTNIELVKGDITATLPKYVEDHPELRISLLHLDVDVYLPSMVILEALYERIVSGGVLVIDDFASVAGETRAVDEFFRDRDAEVRKLPFSPSPAYIRK